MMFIYDNSGDIIGVTYDNQPYFYKVNSQGDVVGIVDSNGEVKTSYYYDAWGNNYTGSTSGLGFDNPIKYRGYYYDFYSGTYYLQSRYYDTAFCRFINLDLPSIAQISKDDSDGMNLYAYCGNDPVNYVDCSGYCYFVYLNKGRSWTHDSWEFSRTNTDFYRINDPTVVYKYTIKGQLDVDTDGAKSKLGSKYYQPETSLKISGKSIDAEYINYIVYTNSQYKGCIATITNNKTKKTIYAIVADYATDRNEFSYAAVNHICPRGKNKKGKQLYWDGSNGPENVNITVIIFKKSKNDISSYSSNKNLTKLINGYGKKYLSLYNHYK